MKRLTAIVAMASIVTATACGTTGKSETDRSGGTYTTIDGTKQINASAPTNPFNPVGSVFNGYNGMALAWPKNDPTDPNRFYPAIARSWTAAPDGSAVVIHLQPNARWSDGKPLTSEDVRVSIGLAYSQGVRRTRSTRRRRVRRPRSRSSTPRPSASRRVRTGARCSSTTCCPP